MWVPTDTKRARRKYTRFSSKGPPLSAFRMYGSPKDGKMLLKENVNWLLSPLLDLYYHGPEFQERLQRPTICILGSNSTPLGLFPQSHTNALPSLQTDGPRHSQGNRRPSLNYSGTNPDRNHIPGHKYLPVHGCQSHGTDRHVDHNGELDK